MRTRRGSEIVKRSSPPSGILALAAVLGLSSASRAADLPQGTVAPAKEPTTATASFEKDVVPFLARHCSSCHGGGKNRGELALDKYRDEKAILQDREVWEN